MRLRPSLSWLRSAATVARLGIALAGLIVVTLWFILPGPLAVAAMPPPQATVLFLPITPSPTSTAFSGPPRRSIPPVTPAPRSTTSADPLPTPLPIILTPVTPVAGVNIQQVGPAMLAEAERQQNMQFNPNAALQKRIFADGLVPNSPEFRATVGGVEVGAQRAESLGSNLVRVYFVVVPNFATVQAAQRGSARNATEEAVLAAGDAAQVIQFNPAAALQKRMFGDGFVPNSSEFSQVVEGVRYIGQRGERLDSGEVRVYFVRDGDFANVFFFRR